MSLVDSDPRLMPRPIRLASPLFDAFLHSHHCAPEHRWRARTTLPVLVLFLAIHHGPVEDRVPWEALDPDALMADSLEIDHEELGFLRDLLCASSSFYAFLGDIGIIAAPSAERLRSRLSLLSLGLAAPRAA